MGMLYKLVPTWRMGAFSLLSLSLIVAGACLGGCAAGSAGGAPTMSLAECMNPSNPLPWWQTYPCNLINGSEGP
jgi:hypothetical protein